MREDHLGRFQMLWDCPFCGSEKLLGLDHRHCPGCGSPQAADKRYYPPEGEEIAVEDHPFHGADRVCPACQTPMSKAADFCGSCGSPMDEAAAAKLKAEARPALPAPAPEPAPKKKGLAAFLGLGCVLTVFGALALFCLVAVFWKKEAGVTVTGHSWARSIAVEQQAKVSEKAWKEDVPAGASGVSCSKEQKSTKRVQSGEECTTVRKDKGDGTYDKVNECKPTYKEEPVYGERCSYSVMKWQTRRTETAGGTSTGDTIAWPVVRLGAGEREGARSEDYTVRFRLDDGKDGSCSTTQQRWASLSPGSTWTAKVSVIGGGIDCEALSPR